jgi:hypothetical protein
MDPNANRYMHTATFFYPLLGITKTEKDEFFIFIIPLLMVGHLLSNTIKSLC